MEMEKQPVSLSQYKRERTKVTREELRRKIDGGECIDNVGRVLRFLEQHFQPIEVNADGTFVAPPALDSTMVAALNAYLNANFKLLNKVLPDLKAIELKDTIADSAAQSGRLMSDTEIRLRLEYMISRASEEPSEPTSLF